MNEKNISKQTITAALKWAAIICVIQFSLPYFAILLENFGITGEFTGALIWTYFITSYPAEFFQWSELPLKGGFFNWPNELATFIGLIVWFAIYAILAATIIYYKQKNIG